MPRPTPPTLPREHPRRFRSTVHGTVFGGRDRLVERILPGDSLRLIPDPLEEHAPGVWVHLESGEPVGHLPPEIAAWLAPWLQEGGCARAEAIRVEDESAPSWRRVLLEVSCLEG